MMTEINFLQSQHEELRAVLHAMQEFEPPNYGTNVVHGAVPGADMLSIMITELVALGWLQANGYSLAESVELVYNHLFGQDGVRFGSEFTRKPADAGKR